MKITKFPQSHLNIAKEGHQIIIDPGSFTFQKVLPDGSQGFKVEQFQDADAFLITHIHPDHLGPDTIKALAGDKLVYGNYDVVSKLKTLGVEGVVIRNGEELEIAGFKVKAVDLPHFPFLPGIKMPPNTGFIIDEIFFDPGDGYKIDGLSVDNAALPIGHPFVSTMSVLEFAKSLNAKTIIPIHYDAYPRDPEELKKIAEQIGIEVRILNSGEETEI